MSDVAESGSGPPAGEIGDQTETIVVVIDPAPAADDTTITTQNADTTLHAVLSMAETDAVPETGVVPRVGEVLQSDGHLGSGQVLGSGVAGPAAGAGDAAGGSEPAGAGGSEPAGAAGSEPAGIGPVSENGAAAPGPGSQGDAPAKLNGASRAIGPDQAPAVSKPAGPERPAASERPTEPERPAGSGRPAGPGRPTGQARTGQAPARRSQAGTGPHSGQAGVPRRGTTSPAGTPPRPGQAGNTSHRPGQAGDTARRQGQAGNAPHRPGKASDTAHGPGQGGGTGRRPGQGSSGPRRPGSGTASPAKGGAGTLADPATGGTRAGAGAPPRPGRQGEIPAGPARTGTGAPAGAAKTGSPAGTVARPGGAPAGAGARPGGAPERAGSGPRGLQTGPARPGSEQIVLPSAADAAGYRDETKTKRRISRRTLIQAGVIGGAGVAALPLLALVGRESPSYEPLPTNLSFSLNTDWLFGGQYMAGAESSFYDDSAFAPVTVPHTVAPLSWRYWNASDWQQMWIYRRHFNGGPLISSHRPGNRIIVEFDGVMVNATVVINDQTVATHQGGYLPFTAELTGHVTSGDNLLSVLVDANCLPVPPMSYGAGPTSVDFFQPGGIYRDVRLRVLPRAFLSDIFALPADVLGPQPRVDVECTIDSALPEHAEGSLLVELFDGPELVSEQAVPVILDTPGVTTMKLSLTSLGDITLWSTDEPKLYKVQATLAFPGVGSHVLSRRIGFREASFQPDGFYLNGERLQLFGLNRHQLYPYAGMAMPARVQRMDAEILKREFNCNMVRCSHYPQSPHFLDACDELGLLVWEEAPGWHNVNTAPGWQDLVVQNVRDMVKRDRSRPSVIIWGTRLNETPDLPGLWAATRQAAAQLDGSRPSSGAMARHRIGGWAEDVFAYNDYLHDKATNEALLRPPITGLPYLVTEAVGVDETKPHRFSWADSPAQLAKQAALHGEAQSLARSEISYSGMLAWAAFDYASPEGQDPESLKYAGVADTFRVPKPGAAIYQSQVDPAVRPVIVPVFFWQPTGVFPLQEPTSMIASNCERLEIFIGGAHVTSARPATGPLFGHLPYPPFLVELPPRPPHAMPELMIEGYVGNQQVTELRMSSNPSGDSLALSVDDAAIVADGSDATRAVFRAVDEYGNLRRYLAGQVTLTLSGPATLVGDNPFAFGAYGGLGAVWIRSLPGQTGTITLAASLPELGQAQVQLRSLPATRGSRLA